MKSGRKMTSLGAALRRKFRTPRDAILALGLPADLISLKNLALDSSLKRGSRRLAHDAEIGGEPDLMDLCGKLEDLLGKHLSGPALHEAIELVNLHCGGGDYDRAASDENEEDNEEALRDQRRKTMARVADFLATRKSMSDDEIASELADFPLNGIDRGAADEDLEKLMKNRRRSMASDARRQRQLFDRLFPEAARLDGTPLETSYGLQPERPVAMDGAGSIASGLDFFPEAARIQQAGGGS